MKYNYNTLIKDLPKKIQTDIYNYMKDGWNMYELGTGEKSVDRITKKELFASYTISDIEDQYPVDSLIQQLNQL